MFKPGTYDVNINGVILSERNDNYQMVISYGNDEDSINQYIGIGSDKARDYAFDQLKKLGFKHDELGDVFLFQNMEDAFESTKARIKVYTDTYQGKEQIRVSVVSAPMGVKDTDSAMSKLGLKTSDKARAQAELLTAG